MDVVKMAKLIEAYDAFEVIAESIAKITGEDYRYGVIQKMYGLSEVIESFTVLETEPDDYEDMSEFDQVLEDMELSSKERAELILGIT
ncbi:MAG: hypothetical protein E7307_01420 [Butyrivibrio sp.]|nr:hypothetical protein [Butyrivibrio sp.]